MNKKDTIYSFVLFVIHDLAKDIQEGVEDFFLENSYIDRRYLYNILERREYLYRKKMRYRSTAGTKKPMRNIYSSVSYLKKQGYIAQKKDTHIALTEKGVQFIALQKLEQKIHAKQKKRWDGRWRLLFYDIPEGERVKRNILRSVIKRCGFEKCQQSVWVTKEDVVKEVIEICKHCGLERYVVLVEVKDVFLGKKSLGRGSKG